MKSVCLAFIGLTLAVGSAHANLITNGSFEDASVDPNQGSAQFLTLGAGNNSITGWYVGSGTVDYIGSYWQASDGGRSLDLSGNGPGSVYQAFATVPGQTYSVSFDIAGNPDGAPVMKMLTASVDGTTFSPTFTTTGDSRSSMGWTPETFTFVANSSMSTLTFASDVGDAYGPALDNIGVSAVPLPASLPMFAAGLLGLGGLAWMRRRQSGSGPKSLVSA